LIAWLKANPMIITLGTMVIYQGMALIVSGGKWARVPDGSPFLWIGNGKLGPIAVPSLIFLSLALIMHLILSETTFGCRVYAMGGNEPAAKLVGLKVTQYRIILFVVTGLTSILAAMVVGARAGAGSHFAGLGFEFDAITAAVLGGTYLFGGKGNVARGVWGAILLALLANAQTILGIPTPVQLMVQGAVLAIMVSVQVWATERINLR
jgi:ribose transport system permease protein